MLKRVWAPDESCRVEIGLLDDALAQQQQQQRDDRALKGAVPPSDELAAAGAHPHETTALPSYPEASEAAAPPRVLPSDCILEQLCGMSFPVGLSLHAAALHPTSINAALNWAVNNSKRTDSPMFFPASLRQRDEWAAAAAGVGPSEACRLESLERVVAHACTAPSLQHLLKDSRVALSASASRVIHALLQWKVRSIVLDSVAPPPPSHPLMAKSLLEQALSPLEHAIKRHIPAGFACVHSAQFRKLMAAVHYCNGLGLGGSKCHYSGLPCWCKTDLKVRGSPPLIACVQVSSQVFPGILQNDILMPSDVLQLQALLLLVACQALASKMLEAADAALKRALPSQFNDPLYDFDILDAVATDELLNEAFPNCKDFKGLEHEQLQQQQCLTQVQEQHRVLYQQKLNDHAQQQQKLQEQEAAQRALLSRQLKQQQEQLQELQRQQIAREEEHKRLNENQCNTLQSHVQQQQGHSATVQLVHTAPNIESISVMQHFTSLPDNQYMCNHCGSSVRSRAYHLKRYHGDATAPTQPSSAIPHVNTAPRADLHAAVECMTQQVEAAVDNVPVDNVPVPTELQKPLECAAGQFCPYSNTAASGTCPAGSFCPYANLGPSPSASAINAKRKQMDEVEQQMQNPASMVASMISSVADATLSVDKKRRKVYVAANTDSCSTFTAWNGFAALPMFPKFEHDCTERALLSLLPTLQDQQAIESFLPHASRSEKCDQWMQSRATQQNEPRSFSSAMLDFIQGERVWDPSSRADFVGVDAAIPGIYRSFVVVSAERVKKFSACTVKVPFHQLNQSKTAVDKNRHCMQVKQRVLCHINLPASGQFWPRQDYDDETHVGGSSWSTSRSLPDLASKVQEARRLNRMIMIVCGDAQQNRTLWVKEFRKWAWRYPRLMFASIDVESANQCGHTDRYDRLRKELLGFEVVNGLSFNSIAPHGEPRAFNACNVETQQIFNKLTARYELACSQGEVPAFEKNGIESCLEICPIRALQSCIGQLNVHHTSHSLEFRLEDARYEAWDEGQSDMPCMGFPIQNNLAISPSPQPPFFLLPLLPEQLRSLSWMIQQEAGSTVQGLVSHRERVPVPPFANICSHWRLTADYFLSGGVLADSMGFGKTSCVLALIASQRAQAVSGTIAATLIIVPSHLLFQWQEEIKKFCCLKATLADTNCSEGLQILTISSCDKVPDVETMCAADIVLVSVNLWESKEYLQQYLDFSFTKDEAKEQRAFGGTALKDQAYISRLERSFPSWNKLFASKTERLPLEAYVWRRVVYDEAHEFTCEPDTPGGHIWTMPLRCMRARSRWALTGTPPVYDLRALHRLALLLAVDIGSCSAEPARKFVQDFFRSSERSQPPCAREVIVDVPVQLTTHELLIARTFKFDNAAKLKSNDVEAWSSLLQLCSHYDPSSRSSSSHYHDDMAESRANKLFSGKEDLLERLIARRKACAAQFDSLKRSIAIIDEEERASLMLAPNARESERRASRRISLVGQREETQDQSRKLDAEILDAQSSISFFQSTLSQLTSGQNLPDCPVCMEPMEWGISGTIASCGHLHCVACVQKLIALDQKCPTCRAELRSNWRIITKEERALPDVAAPGCSGPQEFPIPATSQVSVIDFGSKFAAVVTQINVILRSDPTAKILCYVQWDNLKRKAVAAFQHFNISCITLDGNPEVLRGKVSQFQQPIATGASWMQQPRVLLCSLELKAAGLNLHAANHVLLLHPFFSLNPQQARAWESQAIGRVMRPGQRKQVYVWRFVSLNTVEHEMHCAANKDHKN